MKLKFKHQKFQIDAAKAVCDVFAGQPKIERQEYVKDIGAQKEAEQLTFGASFHKYDYVSNKGYNNASLEISDPQLLSNIRRMQREGAIRPDDKLHGKYNITVEMETGTGKTYTYIKTMYELNARYGWTKFIVVVPSVAIREGVYKSFQITQEHFAEEYKKKIRFFIYKSSSLTDIDNFASDSGINVMIINSQAFNATGKDARRIYMKLDSFRSRRPIDIIAKANPILIIDEPQSTEGEKTKERLKEFHPLFTLRYSATHKDTYNMVYRLDALEAYNKKLVKKIAVKGISVSGSTGTEGYLYLGQVVLAKNAKPAALLEYEVKGVKGLRKVVRKVAAGYNVYEKSGELNEYKGYVVSEIDGRTNCLSFTNGVKIYAGEVRGTVSEEQIRRIQIRETIKSHLERERELFYRGIKVLSLFFIDSVSKYRVYDDSGKAILGEYAEIFEDEYAREFEHFQLSLGGDDYLKYLESIKTSKTHSGYFSIDKHKRFIDSKVDRKSKESDDSDAFDLIMRDKERLLSIKEPVRFIFSHSALREGWDNPNVFQICTLKQSGSDMRKRQEVGRGLRLCVDNNGERMDANVLGSDVHSTNVLTVIANESYDEFSKALQAEIAELVADRPREVTSALFENKVIMDESGTGQVIDHALAMDIYEGLIAEGYVKKGQLTDKYYDDKAQGELILAEEVKDCADGIIVLLDRIYNPEITKPDDALKTPVEATTNDNMDKAEFKALWNKINKKSAYIVDFKMNELTEKAIAALDKELRVSQIYFKVETGEMDGIKSKQELSEGASFKKDETKTTKTNATASQAVKYDLVGKLVIETGLTRRNIVDILKGIQKVTFGQFERNPEEFIIKAANVINEQKATVIIKHITYNMLSESYDEKLFTDSTLKGRLGINAVETNKKHIYDYLISDSKVERDLSSELETCGDVSVYVKLPRSFYINTPVGKYSPDWAIAFRGGNVKHIYFVAETKGDMSSLQLRKVEELKKNCAIEHFKAISSDTVKYDVVSNYTELMKIVRE